MMKLNFPGGATVIRKPTNAELRQSALDWIGLAQQTGGRVRYFTGQGLAESANAALDSLQSQLNAANRALLEMSVGEAELRHEAAE